MSLNIFSPHYLLLRALPPRVCGAVVEVHNITGAPIEIVMLMAISAMSVSLNGHVLRTPDGHLMSTQLYCMGIAPPTSGKGRAMREFYAAIRNFDAQLTLCRKQNGDLAGHPALRDLLLVDATWPSLLEVLDGDSNSVVILDEDCIDLLDSDFMRKRGKLNRFFDTPHKESLVRRGNERLVAHRPMLGFCGLVPPDIHSDHQRSTRLADRKSGLAARCLYAYTLDGRSPELSNQPTPSLSEIHEISSRLLGHRLKRRLEGTIAREELSLDAEAVARWQEIKTEIDLRLRSDLLDIQDAAGRATEKTWRIAASLHCFACIEPTGDPSVPVPAIPPITQQAIDAAWRVVEWSFGEFRKVFSPPMPHRKPSAVRIRQEEEARVAMQHWFTHLQRNGGDTLPMTLAQELSWLTPHKFRTVVAHMKSRRLVEEIAGKPPLLLFTTAFLGGMACQEQFSRPPTQLTRSGI